MAGEATENEPQTETLDFLIEQSQRLFEIYGARQSTAETKTAGVVTAAVALATITVAATTSAVDVNKVLASIVVTCVVLSVLVALLARSVAGLRHGDGRLLSSESKRARDALRALRECRNDESSTGARRLALEMWRARERDSHRMAREKERGAAVAGALLGVALICDGALGYLLIAGSG
ncbi:MAG TPA: hypothetical protein VIY71_01585 [Solirubrobacterales bacterium]